jgi:transposase
MGEQRQQYNEDFKRQAINSVQEQQKTVTDIAQKLTPYINKCSVLRI